MDGSSLSGTDFGSFSGTANLPNTTHSGTGVFLRQQVSPVQIGEIQNDSTKRPNTNFFTTNNSTGGHTHTVYGLQSTVSSTRYQIPL